MRLKYFILVLVLLLSACAFVYPPPATHHTSAYLYQFPGYSPVISADGIVIAASDQTDIWLWQPNQPAQILLKMPPGYHAGELAISAHGQSVAGFLAPVLGSNRNNLPFLWHSSSGVQMLPAIAAADYLDEFRVEDTGKTVTFRCYNKTISGCEDGPFKRDIPNVLFKTWNQLDGYQSLSLLKGESRNVIDLAPDLRSYLTVTESRKAGCHYILQRADGSQLIIPKEINNMSCWPITSSESKRYFTSRAGTPNFRLVILDAETGQTSTRRSLPGCSFLGISAIDDLGAVFAQEQCYANDSVWTEGVRVTASGTETLKQWLETSGISASLPLDLYIDAVSGNGETVYGHEFSGIAVGSRNLNRSPALARGPNAPFGALPGFATGIPFIAHVQ